MGRRIRPTCPIYLVGLPTHLGGFLLYTGGSQFVDSIFILEDPSLQISSSGFSKQRSNLVQHLRAAHKADIPHLPYRVTHPLGNIPSLYWRVPVWKSVPCIWSPVQAPGCLKYSCIICTLHYLYK